MDGGPAAFPGGPGAEVGGRNRPSRGHHDLRAGQLYADQRRRMIEAVCELCAERGYANVVISEIVTRAAVSKSTFYAHYETKDACLFDAHKHLSAHLLAAIDSARGDLAPGEALRAAIEAILAYAAGNPSAAQLLCSGILAAGPQGRERYWATIEAAARRLCPSGAEAERHRALSLAAALFAAPLIATQIDREGPEALGSLKAEFLRLAQTCV